MNTIPYYVFLNIYSSNSERLKLIHAGRMICQRNFYSSTMAQNEIYFVLIRHSFMI